jgi:hypothetical protein
MKSGIRWPRHIAHMTEMRNAQNFGQKNLKGTDHLQDLGKYENRILKWILKNQRIRVWPGFIWLRLGGHLWDVMNFVMNLWVA